MTEFGDAEELGFQDDREPWLHRHRRLVAIAAALVLVLAGAVYGGRYLYQRSLLPSPPPDAPFPPATAFQVWLCSAEFSNCTPGDEGKVLAAVRQAPGVVSAQLVTGAQAAGRLKAARLDDSNIQFRVPSMVEGTLRRREDFAAFRSALVATPGVMLVDLPMGNFWKGKADFLVLMCAGRDGNRCTATATAAQRDAVAARLRALDAVEDVYLQDQAFSRRMIEHYRTVALNPRGTMPEQLYVRLGDPKNARSVARAVLGMPGVDTAVTVSDR
ncbi:MAG: hypothetical protein HOY71_31445 [Nonomuraea sp.]|nr:hypothetical protein [Nonomuraea sp.]